MGPHYSSRRPVRFVPDATPSSADDALRVLAALQTLEGGEAGRPDSGDSGAPEWQALQSRLDLLVTLVSQISRHLGVGQRPPARELLLSGDTVSWTEAPEPTGAAAALAAEPSGSLSDSGPGCVEMHLHEAYPEPLRLAADLHSQRAPNGQIERICRLQFEHGELEDAWHRHVFRHHRRSVARKQHDDVSSRQGLDVSMTGARRQ